MACGCGRVKDCSASFCFYSPEPVAAGPRPMPRNLKQLPMSFSTGPLPRTSITGSKSSILTAGSRTAQTQPCKAGVIPKQPGTGLPRRSAHAPVDGISAGTVAERFGAAILFGAWRAESCSFSSSPHLPNNPCWSRSPRSRIWILSGSCSIRTNSARRVRPASTGTCRPVTESSGSFVVRKWQRNGDLYIYDSKPASAGPIWFRECKARPRRECRLECGRLGSERHALSSFRGASDGGSEFLSASLLSPPGRCLQRGQIRAGQGLPAYCRNQTSRQPGWPPHPGRRGQRGWWQFEHFLREPDGNGAKSRISRTKSPRSSLATIRFISKRARMLPFTCFPRARHPTEKSFASRLPVRI